MTKKKQSKTKKNNQQTNAPKQTVPIIGIGASAGGLESIEDFFTAMPSHSGFAFVVVQHLSPDFKSFMPELLKRKTPMPVHAIEDQMQIQVNNVYLLPPKKNVILFNHNLILQNIDRSHLPNKPIDLFFHSLSQQLGPDAIGIILSGTGSDGSLGIQTIHEAGGKVLVESLTSAKFDGMPKAAMATQMVDVITTPEKMPKAIEKIFHTNSENDSQETRDSISGKRLNPDQAKIFQLIRDRYNVNFNNYKFNTIERRLEKRMQTIKVESVKDYVDYLMKNPQELSTLYYEFLIGVTTFFRDHEAFQLLNNKVIPQILQNRKDEENIRIWVPGCASGEEAYSIAILLDEYIRLKGKKIDYKIFATDIDDEILNKAATGVFYEESLKNVKSGHLKKYFIKENGHYKIAAHIRKNIVFARHDVLVDPPFTKLDLVSCRNLLIYFGDSAQKTVLSSFYFSLNQDGFLFLGPSESLGKFELGYQIIDRSWRIFRKAGDKRLSSNMLTAGRRNMPIVPVTQVKNFETIQERQKQTQIRTGLETLLQDYVPPSILVNDALEILHIFGDAGKYLRLKSGLFDNNLKNMLDENLATAVGVTVQRSKKEKSRVFYKDIFPKKQEGEPAFKTKISYDITVRWLENSPSNFSHLFLVSLEEKQDQRDQKKIKQSDQTIQIQKDNLDEVSDLKIELQHTKENLQATIEELETTNEELQSTNEELLSSNEELQSTNEELHSVNEELYTVNSEYQNKIDELTQLTLDEENLLTSTEIGVVFLDQDLHVRKFTPAIAEAFYLMPQDIGRPIEHITHSLQIDNLVALIRNVLDTHEAIEKELQSKSGKWYHLRIRPYQSQADGHLGIVLVFNDVSTIKEAQTEIKQQKSLLDSVLELNVDGWWEWDLTGDQTNEFFSPNFKKFLGYKESELDNKSSNWKKIIHPEDYELTVANFKKHVATNGEHPYYQEIRVLCKDGSHKWVITRGHGIKNANGDYVRMIGTHTDITALKTTEQKLKKLTHELVATNKELERFAYVASHDLKEPLRTISNYVDIFVEDYHQKVDQEGQKTLTTIKAAAKRMKILVDSLLSYSRVSSRDLKIKGIDSKKLFDDVLSDLHNSIESSHAKIELPEKMPQIKGDETQMYQLIQNLIGNSLKFVQKGKKPNIKVSCKQSDANTEIKIQDNGIGFENGKEKMIFLPFHRLHNDNEYDGTGMGLTICQKIAAKHSGKILVDSKPGKGSTFKVVLPK